MQAIAAFDHSRIPEGISRSRYPSSLPQNIPPFSLLWIGMLHDYWMYRPDPQIVRDSTSRHSRCPRLVRKVRNPTGCSASCPGGVSSTGSLSGEIPTYDTTGRSCVTTLQYLGALIDASDLERHLGDSGARDALR